MNNFMGMSSVIGAQRFRRKSFRVHPSGMFFRLFLFIAGLCIASTCLAEGNYLQITGIVQSPANPVISGSSVNYTLTVQNTDMQQNRFAVIRITSGNSNIVGAFSSVAGECTPDGDFYCTEIVVGQSAQYTFTWQPPVGQHDLVFTVNCSTCLGNDQSITTNVIQAPTGTIQYGSIAEQQGLSKNQKSVAKAVDSMCVALAGMGEERSVEQDDLLRTCQRLEADDLTTVAANLDLLAHEEVSAQGRVILETAKLQSASIHRRLVALRGGARGVNLSGLNIRIDGQTLPESVVTALFGDNARGGSAGEEQGIASRWGSFVNATVIVGDRDKTRQETGFNFRAEGITAGADYRISDKLVVGSALGYTGKNSDFKGNAGDMDINNWHLTAYGSYYRSTSFYLDGLIKLGKNNIDTRRRINLPGDPLQEGVGDTTGREYAVSLSSGYEYSRNALTFGPYGRLGYIKTSINGYTETASNPGNPGTGSVLTIDNQTVDSTTAVLGGQATYAISARNAVYLLQLNGEWEHEFRDNSRAIAAQFAYDPTRTSFNIASDSPDRNYFNLGLGITATFANGRSGFFQYESRLGQDNVRQYWINGGIRIEL